MFDLVRKNKGAFTFFATVKPNENEKGTKTHLPGKQGHLVYLSAYGQLASALLEKYVDGQRSDNEEMFARWDKSLQEASSRVGFADTHEVEDGYIYITTFQNGIGVSPEDEAGIRLATRIRRRRQRITIPSPDLTEGIDEDLSEEIDLGEEIDEVDIDDDH